MSLSAVRKSRPEPIRPIAKSDNAAMATIIRQVLSEFGCTAAGFAIHDPEVDAMFEAYQAPRSKYFVVEDNGRVVGGGGIAPLKGGDQDTCEMQKFYFLPEVRGTGYGWPLITLCLQTALLAGYKRCYVETMDTMKAAEKLYLRAGFTRIDAPMGSTGHFSCNRWYVKELS